MSATMDFSELNRQLLNRAHEFVAAWLPGGRLEGKEWTCASVIGGKGESCKVNIETGKWGDFAAQQYGGDLISLYATSQGITQGQAYHLLSEQVGFSMQRQAERKKILEPPPEQPKPSKDSELINAPADTGLPKEILQSRHWVYRTSDGDIFTVISRGEHNGRKTYRQWSYTDLGWIKKGRSEGFPVYGLDILSKKSEDHPVLIVEGEKACDAARKFISAYMVTTWAGGSSAVRKTDWSSLYGRKVLIWPDQDLKKNKKTGEMLPKEAQPGMKAALQIAGHLVSHCPEVKVIDVDGSSDVDGWDAADCDFNYKEFAEWAKSRVFVYKKPEPKPEPAIEPVSPPDPPPKVITPEIVEDEPPRNEAPMPDSPPPAHVINQNLFVTEDFNIVDDSPPSHSNTSVYVAAGCELNSRGKPLPNMANAYKMIAHLDQDKKIWFDEFYQDIFTTFFSKEKERWSDQRHLLKMQLLLQDQYGFSTIKQKDLSDAIYTHAQNNMTNEPRDWLESLSWDKEGRLDTFFPGLFGSDDNEYTRKVSKNFWISLVARIYDPGCKSDHMVVLEGKQGKGKSSVLELIAGDWFTDSGAEWGSKDFVQGMQHRMIVEIAELDAFSKTEINSVKKFLTVKTDNVRMPYGKKTEPYPRTCVFVGTTNDNEYLKDHTGGRRFWPIVVNKIDFLAVKKYRNQLFAEAVHRYKAGEDWWRVPDQAHDEQRARYESHPWEEKLLVWFSKTQRTEATMLECLVDGIGRPAEHLTIGDKRTVGKALRAIGWQDYVGTRGGRSIKVWRPTEDYKGYQMPLKSTAPDLSHLTNYAPQS